MKSTHSSLHFYHGGDDYCDGEEVEVEVDSRNMDRRVAARMGLKEDHRSTEVEHLAAGTDSTDRGTVGNPHPRHSESLPL